MTQEREICERLYGAARAVEQAARVFVERANCLAGLGRSETDAARVRYNFIERAVPELLAHLQTLAGAVNQAQVVVAQAKADMEALQQAA